MKKKYETRYFVTAVASVPVIRVYGKMEMYRQATEDGWGTVYRDETNTLICDEDCSASLYTKDGGYFGIFPYEEIVKKDMPKRSTCAAIITSDSCGYSVWAEDFSRVHFFVVYDENGLVDSYRVEYGDSPIYDGEVEVAFEDLFEQPEGDWQETYRASLPGTVEYQFKQEADKLAEEAGETWMNNKQREQFRRVCYWIDQIKSARDFLCAMQLLGYDFDEEIIILARKFKRCFNFTQYEQPQEVAQREERLACYEKYELPATDTADVETEAATVHGLAGQSVTPSLVAERQEQGLDKQTQAHELSASSGAGPPPGEGVNVSSMAVAGQSVQ